MKDQFVAAEPSREPVVGDDPRDLREDEIAGEVAASVVDLLEVIDIADHHGPTVTQDALPAVSLPFAAVRQSRQLIAAGLLLERRDPGRQRTGAAVNRGTAVSGCAA